VHQCNQRIKLHFHHSAVFTDERSWPRDSQTNLTTVSVACILCMQCSLRITAANLTQVQIAPIPLPQCWYQKLLHCHQMRWTTFEPSVSELVHDDPVHYSLPVVSSWKCLEYCLVLNFSSYAWCLQWSAHDTGIIQCTSKLNFYAGTFYPVFNVELWFDSCYCTKAVTIARWRLHSPALGVSLSTTVLQLEGYTGRPLDQPQLRYNTRVSHAHNHDVTPVVL